MKTAMFHANYKHFRPSKIKYVLPYIFFWIQR